MQRLNLVIVFSICVTKCLAMSRSELEDFSNFLEMTSQLDFNVKSKGPDDEYDEDEFVSDNAWEESGKFEGDLILNERQRRLLVADVAEGLSRNGLQDSTKRWPNNEVIYYIQKEHFSSGQVQAIQEGIDDLVQASCVKFKPYQKGDRDAVVIQGSRRGCFSQVGYQGGYQVLNLSGRHPVGRGCFRHGTVVHELLHALGFYHMQSSPDRDDYIDVLWQNIVQPARHNFRKYNSFAVSDFGVGYDYESVLHYSRKAFSRNGQDTLVPKQGGAEIGQRVGLSQKDTQKLNKMYCDADSNDAINSDDDSTPKKPVIMKKNSKNKPFDGHGIGYHQGKTVVIKLKPTVELYGLRTLPKFHMFDYFSKAPQAMSPSITERSRKEKKMIHVSSISSANENYYIPTSKSLLPIKGKDQEEYEGKTDVKMVSHGENDKNPSSTGQMIMNNVFLEEANDDMQNYFKKMTEITRDDFPTYTSFNPNYSKYMNPEYKYEKEPEIVKVDEIFMSSKMHTKDSLNNSYKKPDTGEFQHNVNLYKNHDEEHKLVSFLPQKHDSLAKDDSEKIYPLRKYYYNPDEVNVPEFQSPFNYFSGQSQNNDTDSVGHISLENIPIKETWYTDNRYKQNPNQNYDRESFSYDPVREKEKNTVNPHVRHYVISDDVHSSEKNNQNPYLLFDAPVPLTHKWYRKDEPEQ